MKPAISVVIVTYNPQRHVLAWAMDSIERQTVPSSAIELVIVDNNSDPPLDEEALRAGRSLDMRVVREPRQGNIFARCTGIMEARNELIVFVDDDNCLAPDYLEKALRIARDHPRIGAFSGICAPAVNRAIPIWKRPLLPALAIRNYGPKPITSSEDRWGPWEPPTSGMVLRKAVGEKFVEFVRNSPAAASLGRKGKASLLSCEDSLLARMAYRLGYACSYQPALKLYHYLRPARLRTRYLARLHYALGRSYIMLKRTLGTPLEDFVTRSYPGLLRRLFGRIRAHGLAGLVLWSYDIGCLMELRKNKRRA